LESRIETQSFPGPEQAGAPDFLNIAAVCPSTHALGPGARAAVWVQGCVFHCPGCIAPDWIPLVPRRIVSPADLVEEILADPNVEGLTFSGGEPMLQAAGLAHLARLARARRNLNIICFSGFSLAHLLRMPPGPGVDNLLSEVDVLIDGPYIDRFNDNRGLRGSSNQRIHYLTDRLTDIDLASQPRKAEVTLFEQEIMLVGVPPKRLGDAFNLAVDQAVRLKERLLHYERL
jgi:anaerobic ribonucleoside-triphosphate reductase activating protein